jgi:hypothetical protein
MMLFPIDNPNMNPRVRWRSQDSNILLKSHFLHIYILCTITSYGIKYIFNALKTILKNSSKNFKDRI